MSTTKQCENTGIPAGLLRKAVATWKRLDIDPKAKAAASYVASLPPPPMPNSPEYYRCISRWYQCFMQAQYLDQYYTQIAQLQQQMATGELLLTAYLDSYANCIGGIMT
jgi:hypothetical protein